MAAGDQDLGFNVGARDQASNVFRRLAQAVDEANRSVGRLDQARAEPRVELDDTRLREQLDRAQDRLRRLQSTRANPQIDADIRAAETKIDVVRQRLQDLRNRPSSVRVRADIASAEAQLVRLGQRVQQLNDRRASPRVDADIAAAQASVDRLQNELNELNNRDVTVRATVNSRGFGDAAREASNLASNALRAGAAVGTLGAGIGIVTALAGAFASAAGAAALIPSALGGGLAVMGTLKLGLGGVTDAYNAVTAADSAGGGSAGGNAQARIAAARAVESAQRALADAYRQADRQAIQSAQAVADAQQALARAQRSAAQAVADAQQSLDRAVIASARQVQAARERVADAQASAARRVASAEQNLERAQRTAVQAQLDLNRARQEAAEQLEDLQLSLEGAALDEEAAVLALERARERLAKMPRNASTLDWQEAELGVKQAELALKETRERYTDLQEESTKAAEAGVEGSELVKDAQQNLADANRGVADAEAELNRARIEGAEEVADAQAALRQAEIDGAQQVADAQESLRRAQIDGAQQVADAEQALQRARQQAAWAAEDSAKTIADAQRNLAEALQDQASSGAAAGGGINAAADAMSKLAPAAQELVRALAQLAPRWEQLQKNVQQSLLAGVADEILKLADIYLPKLEHMLVSIAGSFNRAFMDVSGLLQTEAAIKDLQFGFDNIATAIDIASKAAKPLTQIFLDLFAVGSEFLPDLARGFLDVANRASQFVSEARKSGELRAWIADAIETLKQLWQIFENVGATMAAVFGSGRDEGSSFLEMLVEITGAVRAFFESAATQEVLHTLFAIIQDLGPELLILAAAIKGASMALAGFRAAQAAMQTIRDIQTWAAAFTNAMNQAGNAAGRNARRVRAFATAAKLAAGALGLLAAEQVAQGAAEGYTPEQDQKFQQGDLGSDLGTFAQEAADTNPLQALGKELRASLTPPEETKQLWNDFSGWWSSLWGEGGTIYQPLKDFNEGTKTWLGQIWNDFTTWLGGLPAMVGQWFSDMWNQATTWLGQLWTDITTWLGQVWTDFTTWLGGLPAQVGLWFSDMWNQATTWLGQLWTDITTWLGQVWTDFTTWLGGLPGQVGLWFSDMWTQATTWLGQLWTDITTWLGQVWNDFTTWLGSLPGKVGEWFSQMWNEATTWLGNLVRDANEKAGEILRGIGDWLQQLPQKASEWFQGMLDSARRKGQEIVDWARNLPGEIVNAISNLGRDLYNSGLAAIGDFWRGLQAKWGELVRWVQDSMAWLRGFWPFSPAERGPFSGRGYVTYSGMALTGDFADSLVKGTPGIIASARRLMEGVHDELGTVDGPDFTSALAGRALEPVTVQARLAGDQALTARWQASQATAVGTAARPQVTVQQEQVVAAIHAMRAELASRIANARQVNYAPTIIGSRQDRTADALAMDARTASDQGIFG